MSLTGYKIHSWNSFVSQPVNKFEHNYHSMIKVKLTDRLAQKSGENQGLVRVAVSKADARYSGIYYGLVVVPNNPATKGYAYIILWDNWKGYPLDCGYAVLLPDNSFPKFIEEFKHNLRENICQDSCWV